MNNPTISNTYNLSGGSKVTVDKPYDSNTYLATVEMPKDSVYPEEHQIALDINRSEFIRVVSGVLLLTVNENTVKLNTGDTYLLKHNDYYSISTNTGCIAVVLVEDKEDGETKIIYKKDLK